jgi:serine/threonine protein kinase
MLGCRGVEGCVKLDKDWAQVEALFDAAWDLAEADRVDWLRAQSAPAYLIDRAIGLVRAAQDSGDFLEDSTGTPAERRRSALSVGARIGVWQVIRPIGRGGMGEVYQVERADGQFRQRAALKVIAHSGESSWQHFQAERQILARLDHPGIARLIDGGLLDSGRPYMVMEFVDGEPIDAYCERRALGLRARVDLTIQLCDALAHAHGQLVVHSDLKPSNILVDGDGRPRLIDFGVAHLADASRITGRPVLLSPDYAAPEQFGGDDVSMATDTYGLAATLYRLVAGVPPRQTAGLASPIVLTQILEHEPAPSRLGPTAALWRRSQAQRALADDLDAILARALSHDVASRYPTAQAMRVELSRARDRRVVDARRHQRGHVARRTIHRYRWPVAGIGAVVTSLAIGLGAALWQATEARRQRDESQREQARLEAVQQSVFHMFRSAGELKGGEASAADVLDHAAQRIQDEFARDPDRGAPVLQALGELYLLINDYEAATPLLERLASADASVVDPALIAAGRFDLAQVRFRQGDAAQAAHLLRVAQTFWQRDPQRWAALLIESRLLEAQLLRDGGDAAAAISLLERARDEQIGLSGPVHRDTGVFHNNLGVTHMAVGDFAAARAAFRAASQVWRDAGLAQSPDALNTLNNWGAVEIAAGDPVAAEPLLREATDLRQRYFGPSAATAAALGNYGKLLLMRERHDAALPVLLDAAEMGRRFAGHGSLHHVAALSGVAEAQLGLGRKAEGLATAQAALSASLQTLGRNHPGAGMAGLALARAQAEQGQFEHAANLVSDAERIASDAGPAGGRLREQADSIRRLYRLPAHPRVLDTATPSP